MKEEVHANVNSGRSVVIEGINESITAKIAFVLMFISGSPGASHLSAGASARNHEQSIPFHWILPFLDTESFGGYNGTRTFKKGFSVTSLIRHLGMKPSS